MKLDVQHIIIAVVLVFWGFYGVALVFAKIPPTNSDLFIGWGSAVGSVIHLIAGYYWGQSSKRNEGKDDAMDK